MAYEKVAGPLGSERSDVLTALLAALIHNTALGVKRAKKPQDFMPEWDRRPRSAEGMLNVVRALNAMYGGEVRDAD